MDDQRTDRKSGKRLLLAIILLAVAGIAVYSDTHADLGERRHALRMGSLIVAGIAGAVAWCLLGGVKLNKK